MYMSCLVFVSMSIYIYIYNVYAHSQSWATSYPCSAEPSLVDLWLRWASSLLIMVTQQDSMQIYPINSFDLPSPSNHRWNPIPRSYELERSNTQQWFLLKCISYWGAGILELQKKNRKVHALPCLTLLQSDFTVRYVSIFKGCPIAKFTQTWLLWGGGQVAEPGSVVGIL